jgi:ribonuclease P protein component
MAGSTRPDQGLARHQRLTQSRFFEESYAQRNKHVGRYMILWLRSGEGAALRLGVVTSRKVGHAVIRTRARRRIREVYRRNRAQLAGAWDVVIIVRASLAQATHDEITRDFLELAARAGLLKSKATS